MKNTLKKWRTATGPALATLVAFMFTSQAWAMTAPTANNQNIGYWIYDFLILRLYEAGGQYAIAILLLGFAAWNIKEGWQKALGCAVAAGVIAASATIANGLGAIA